MKNVSKRQPRTILAMTITLILVLSIGLPTAFAESGSDGSCTLQKKNNEFLNDLVITNGTLSPAFDPDKLKYTVALDEHTSTFNIDAVSADPLNKVYMNNRQVMSGRIFSLENGSTRVVKVKVVTPEKKTRTYTVAFTRPKSTNAELGSLKVKGGEVQPVVRLGALKTKDVPPSIDYICAVPIGTKKVTVYATAAERHAWLSINGRVVRSRTITLNIPPPRGGEDTPKGFAPNIVTIVVKAQAGNMKAYTLLIGYKSL